MSSISKGRLELIGVALLFSTGGAAIKAAAFSGWQIASLRSGFAAVTPLADKSWAESRVEAPVT
jgi:hypothetical protein